jgi:hypothetical protein
MIVHLGFICEYMIRNATPSDIKAITELGIESLEVNDPYPQLRIDPDKVKDMATDLVSSAANFAWVSEIDGCVVGAVCGLSHDLMFYERKQLSVVMFYCRVPGDGGRLIKKLVEWYYTRPILKLCVFTLESNADPKLGDFLVKMGLKRELPNYVGVK